MEIVSKEFARVEETQFVGAHNCIGSAGEAWC